MTDTSWDFRLRYGSGVFPNLFRSANGAIVTDTNVSAHLDLSPDIGAPRSVTTIPPSSSSSNVPAKSFPLLQRHDIRDICRTERLRSRFPSGSGRFGSSGISLADLWINLW